MIQFSNLQPSGSVNDEVVATRQTFGEDQIAVPSAPSMQNQQVTSGGNLEAPDIIITGSGPMPPPPPPSPGSANNPPPYAAVRDWSPSRTSSRTPSRSPSPDRRSARGGPPPYEAVSHRPEENPSDTGLPPPSYEEVIDLVSSGKYNQ